MFEQLLPTIHAKDKSTPDAKRKPKKGKGYDPEPGRGSSKYDHKQMIEDRLSGMTWTEVARKHGVQRGRKRGAASMVSMLVMHSRAIHSLTPEQVLRLGQSTR